VGSILQSLGRAIRRGRRAPVVRAIPAAPPSPLELLGREAINLDTPELQRFVGGKRVLVTGAGGSIGSEICRQAMKFCPASLVLLDRCENALFEIDQELRHRWLGADLRPYMADVTDAQRIKAVFDAERPHVVFHAAAHKHVPLMEANPGEAVKNNVFGTQTVADAALAARCHAFVLISTDKAVNPTSVMGATKRVAELYVQALNQTGLGSRASGLGGEENPTTIFPETRSPKPETRFVAVRFGNVLGSSGSVVPIFAKQIAAGGPVTVTHAQMRRYFMTIPEASQLVMQAGAIGTGGDICVLDMGEPVRILDLAEEMIRRNGLVPASTSTCASPACGRAKSCSKNSPTTATPPPRRRTRRSACGKLPRHSKREVDAMLARLSDVVTGDRDDVIGALMDVVPEYRPAQSVSSARDESKPLAA
jgi:FlaA1/EpsC-like NDP-sugar epimerase